MAVDLTSKKALIISGVPINTEGVTVDPDDNNVITVDGGTYENLHTNVANVHIQEGTDDVYIRTPQVCINLEDEGSVDVYNLKPENIKSGVTILGVTGNLEGSSGTTSQKKTTLTILNESECEVRYAADGGTVSTTGNYYKEFDRLESLVITVYKNGAYYYSSCNIYVDGELVHENSNLCTLTFDKPRTIIITNVKSSQ